MNSPVPRILLDHIKLTWIRFCKQESPERQSVINGFCRQQPFIYEYVEAQDKEWFPGERGKIRTLALFVWLVFMAEHRGQVPLVTREHLATLLSEGITKLDLLDAESEIRATEIASTDVLRHPQIDLCMFLMGHLTHKEDCFELIPEATKAAHHHLDFVIRALDAVTSRNPPNKKKL